MARFVQAAKCRLKGSIRTLIEELGSFVHMSFRFNLATADSIQAALTGDPISAIVRRRSLLEPESELAQCMGQAPFVKNSSGHGEGGAGQFRSLAAQRIIEQPFFKGLRLRVIFDRPSQQRALDRKPESVGRLIPFPISSSSF
jgi:hypothetical protein